MSFSFASQICSDEWTDGEWLDVDLDGRRRFPYAFIGPMAAAMQYAQDPTMKPSTEINDALKTMLVVDAAYESSLNMSPIKYGCY